MQRDLLSRIAALERSNRRLRRAFGLFVLVAAALLTTAMGGDQATAPALEDLRVRSLDVVNDDGVVVVHLGVRSSGAGGFWLTDSRGRRVLHLNQNVHGAGRIAVSNADGGEAAVLTADVNGDGHLHLDRID